MIKHYCDRCGKEMQPDMYGNMSIGLWVHYEPDEYREAFDSYKKIVHDICQDCGEKIEEEIRGYCPTKVL